MVAVFAYGINDAGEVVGTSATASGSNHAFLYSNGVMQDLGTGGKNFSGAFAINDAGQVVGEFGDGVSGHYHAMVYSDGVMQDLNDLVVNLLLGVTLEQARGINDLGWIVANGSDNHAYMLIPGAAPPSSPVPLPSALLLLGAGLFRLANYGRRKRASKV
jgi:probable HAF family extracellular repeat protein